MYSCLPGSSAKVGSGVLEKETQDWVGGFQGKGALGMQGPSLCTMGGTFYWRRSSILRNSRQEFYHVARVDSYSGPVKLKF